MPTVIFWCSFFLDVPFKSKRSNRWISLQISSDTFPSPDLCSHTAEGEYSVRDWKLPGVNTVAVGVHDQQISGLDTGKGFEKWGNISVTPVNPTGLLNTKSAGRGGN